MSELEKEIAKGEKATTGFFKYITTFDKEQKSDILNMMQYSILAIIPIMLVLRGVNAVVPEDDESKGSLEITLECVLQIMFLMVSIWLTDRIIRYIPTYSKVEYGKFCPVNFIVPFLIILITMQSKLGFKLNIVVDRLLEKWNGKAPDTGNTNGGGGVKGATAAQAQSANFRVGGGNEGFANKVNHPVHNPSQADSLGTKELLGSSKPGIMPGATPEATQPSPDFNSMYEGPDQNMAGEPMAANGVLSGSFGSAW
tara:strand:+ start:1280 stop:2044 length:765 start_codon:yes stop_codon:yes gene_type:complete